MSMNAAQVLRKKSPAIMNLWEERARQEVCSTYGHSSLLVRDSLAKHLEQLAAAFESSKKLSTTAIATATIAKADIGKEHGDDRARIFGYSIDEVILEYRIFRQIIIQVLEEEIPLSVAEREIITDLIEQAVNDAASQFTASVREMSDHFTATLTHDLRNPVTSATTSAELILRNPDRPEVCTKNARRIVESLHRIDRMIQDLLDAGRIRAGESLPAKVDVCDPVAVAREVLNEMTSIHGDRFVLRSDVEVQTWWSCDLYRRALENLLQNAVKYGDPEAAITVSLAQADSAVKSSVHNEGNPIPEGEKSALFQTYHRAKAADASTVRGWGLGLTLVEGVAKAHHGAIEMESSEAIGTTFSLILPNDCRGDAA